MNSLCVYRSGARPVFRSIGVVWNNLVLCDALCSELTDAALGDMRELLYTLSLRFICVLGGRKRNAIPSSSVPLLCSSQSRRAVAPNPMGITSALALWLQLQCLGGQTERHASWTLRRRNGSPACLSCSEKGSRTPRGRGGEEGLKTLETVASVPS